MNKILAFGLFIGLLVSCGTKEQKKDSVNYSTQPVKTPVLFAEGIISTKENNEFHLAFSPNGKTAYFSRRIGDEKQKIWETTFENAKWTEPQIASFSTDRDETPFVSPDGKYLFFGSSRPIDGKPSKGNFDMNIWQTENIDGKWSDPKPLPETINRIQVEKEEWPSSNENLIFSIDGSTYYYSTMMRGTKAIDIYKTVFENGQFSTPKKVEGIFDNEKFWKYSPVLSPDGEYLIFNSYEATGGRGGEDIYVCKKTQDGWTSAKNIGSIVNTEAEEGSVNFSSDGKYFFFSREYRENKNEDGIWSIYFLETEYLYLDKLFQS